jgi:RHS repeat-associated protein
MTRRVYRSWAAMAATVALVAGMTFAVATSVAAPVAAAAGSSGSSSGASQPATPTGFVAGLSAEVVGARSQFTKTYLNPDGSNTLVSSQVPINYQDAHGLWEPVDSSVVADSAVAGGLRSAANAWTVHFEPLPTGLVVDTANGSTLSFSPLGVSAVAPTVTADGQGVVYTNAWPGVDLEYVVSPVSVEEKIILHQQPASSSFSFATGATGFTAASDGGLIPAGAAGQATSLAAPVVLDSLGRPVAAATPVLSSSGSGSANQVAVSVSPAWLDSLTASDYPVVIDPSLIMGSSDLQHYSSTGASCSCGLTVGNSGSGSTNVYWRAVGEFDYSSIDGDAVSAASIQLGNNSGLTANYTISAYHASAWSYAGAESGSVLATGPGGASVNMTGSGLLSDYQTWVADSTSPPALGFTGLEYAGQNSFEDYLSYQLTLTYDSYPNTVTSPATTPATTCTTGSGRPYINTTTPTLNATVSDPDGGTLKGAFEIWNTGGAEIGGQNYSASVSSGAVSSWAVPSGNFVNGSTYSWRARGYDGTLYSKSYSPFCEFTIDTTAPAAPTISSSSDPSSSTWYTTGAFTGTWTDSDTSGIAGYAVVLNNTATTVPAATVTQTTTSYSHTVTSGTWYLHVRAENGAGSWGATATYTFHVEINAATWVAPTSGSELQGTVTLQAMSGPDATGATFEVYTGGAWETVGTTTSHNGSWVWSESWNTLATSGGTRIYPNGPYQTGMQLQYSSGPGQLVDGPMLWVGDGPVLSGETRGGSNPSETDITQPATKAGDPGTGVSVDDATGELDATVTDDQIPGNGLPLDLTRTYASTNAATLGPFGYGWTNSYNMTVTTDPVWGATVKDVTQENGSIVRFAQDGSGNWIPPSRVQATLSYNTSTSQWTFTRHGQDTYVFNSAGQLLSEQSIDGYATTLTYNGSNQLTTVTDPAGRTLTLAWGACGSSSCVAFVTDPGSRTVHYTYDTNANLTGVQDVAGNSTIYGYDTVHRLTSVKDANANTTTFAYNTANEATSETDPLTQTTTWAYTQDGYGDGTTTVTDPLGYQTQDTFTIAELTSQIQAYGTSSADTTSYTYSDVTDGVATKTTAAGTSGAETTTYTYDTAGDTTNTVDPAGDTTAATYNASNQTATSTNPLGEQATDTYTGVQLTQSTEPVTGGTASMTLVYGSQPGNPTTVTTNSAATQYGYDSYGDQISVTDALGNTTTYTYNVLGQKTSMVSPRGNVTGANPAAFTTTYAYDAYGNLTQTTDPGGDVTKASFDPLGNQLTATDGDGNQTTSTYNADSQLTKTTQADGTTITTGYDADGRKISQTDANGNTTTWTYNPLDQQLTETDPLGHTTSDTYDLNGNTLTATDADGNVTTNTYDAANRLTQISEPDGTTRLYTYDADGNQTGYTDGAGNHTTYSYDTLDQLVSTTDPLGHVTTDTYNANGNKATEINPDGRTTTWTYNADNKPTGITYSDGVTPAVTYTYDPDGNITASAVGSGDYTNTYDTTDRLIGYQNAAAATVSYGYDSASNPTSITYPNAHTVTQGYDTLNRLSSVTDWNSNTTRFGYDPDGNLTTTTYPNGVVDTRTYNTASQLTNIADTNASTSLAFAYTPDPAGQITAETDTGTPNPGTTNYTYNTLDQLTAAGSNTYSYDHAADLITSPSGATQAFNTDSQPCWTGTGTGSCTTPPTGATTYTYSTEGNRTTTTPSTGTSDTYNWSQNNQLTAVTPSTGNPTTYGYDANGLLQTETTGATTTQYAWDTQADLPLLLSDGTNYYIYGIGSSPIEQINAAAGATSYLLSDQSGSTRAITNTTGTITATYTYDAWGNQTGYNGTTVTPFQYGGQYADPATGLIYLRARWYDPQTGQFLSLDPDLATTNSPYTYANDDPVQNSDPTGLGFSNEWFHSVDWEMELSVKGSGLTLTGLNGTLWNTLKINNDCPGPSSYEIHMKYASYNPTTTGWVWWTNTTRDFGWPVMTLTPGQSDTFKYSGQQASFKGAFPDPTLAVLTVSMNGEADGFAWFQVYKNHKGWIEPGYPPFIY